MPNRFSTLTGPQLADAMDDADRLANSEVMALFNAVKRKLRQLDMASEPCPACDGEGRISTGLSEVPYTPCKACN